MLWSRRTGRQTFAHFAFLLPLVAACGGEQVYRIGVVVGADGLHGARLAADSVNRAGGIAGRPLELIVLEGQWLTSAEAAIRAADSLSRHPGVLAVIGHSNSSASLAASQVYNAAKVVQIAPNSSAAMYRGAGPYSYRMVGSDARQAAFLVEELRRRNARRTVVLYVNDDYGRTLQDSVVYWAEQRGVPLVLRMPHLDLDSFPDIGGIARRIAVARPDVILWLGRGIELHKILEAVRPLLPTVPVLASDGIGSVCCTGSESRAQFLGVAYARMTDPAPRHPAMLDLRRTYTRQTGEPLTDQAALTYDAILLLADVIGRAGADREAIRRELDALQQSPFAGVTGRIAFDSAGDARTPYFLDTVRSTP